jgi:hypothetical protein
MLKTMILGIALTLSMLSMSACGDDDDGGGGDDDSSNASAFCAHGCGCPGVDNSCLSNCAAQEGQLSDACKTCLTAASCDSIQNGTACVEECGALRTEYPTSFDMFTSQPETK